MNYLKLCILAVILIVAIEATNASPLLGKKKAQKAKPQEASLYDYSNSDLFNEDDLWNFSDDDSEYVPSVQKQTTKKPAVKSYGKPQYHEPAFDRSWDDFELYQPEEDYYTPSRKSYSFHDVPKSSYASPKTKKPSTYGHTKTGSAYLKTADTVNTQSKAAPNKGASAGTSFAVPVVAIACVLLLATGGAYAYRRRTTSLKASHSKIDAANARTNTGEFGSAGEPQVSEYETGQTVTVKTPYVSQRIDELTVEYGDQVLVRQIFSDGWALGEVIGTGNVGVFPLCMCSKQQGSTEEVATVTSPVEVSA